MRPVERYGATALAGRSWVARLVLWLAAALLLKAAEPFAVPVAYAVALAFVLSSPVRKLAARDIRPAVGAALVVSGLLCVVALVGFAVVKPASEWWHRAPATVERMVNTFDQLRSDALAPFGAAVDRAHRSASAARAGGPPSTASSAAPAPSSQSGAELSAKVASEGYTLTRALAGHLITFAFSAVATVVLLYFLLASQDMLLAHLLQRVTPGRQRALFLSGLRQVQRDVGLFLGTMCLMNVLLGAATAIGLAFIGLPNAFLWGTVTAVLTCIPYLGPLLVAVALLFAGGVDAGIGDTLAPPAIFLGLHAIEASLISPALMGHRLRLNAAAVIVSVMLWGWIWGVAGALLAVPLLLTLRVVCRRRPALRGVCAFLDGRSSPLPGLRQLLGAPPVSAPPP